MGELQLQVVLLREPHGGTQSSAVPPQTPSVRDGDGGAVGAPWGAAAGSPIVIAQCGLG